MLKNALRYLPKVSWVVAVCFALYFLYSIYQGQRHEIQKLQEDTRSLTAKVFAVESMSNDAIAVFSLVEHLSTQYPNLTSKQTSSISMAIIENYKRHKAVGLTVPTICGIIEGESGFLPTAKSDKYAYGLMQLLASTAKPYAEKDGHIFAVDLLYNPTLNIKWGCDYLMDLHRIYMNEGLETTLDFRKSITSYYWGERLFRIYYGKPNAGAVGLDNYFKKIDPLIKKWEKIIGRTA